MKNKVLLKTLAMATILSCSLFRTELLAAPADTQQSSSVASYGGKYYDTVQEAITEAATSGGTVTMVNNGTDQQFAINSGNVTLNLNGKTLDGAAAGSVIEVETGAEITITGDGAISGGAQGVYNKGTVTLLGGTITANGNNTVSGGGVYNEGTFNMKGGAIKANSAALGGGVCNNGGTFNMGTDTSPTSADGGEISGNVAVSYGGGIYCVPNGASKAGILNINAGFIKGNTAGMKINGGGGIYVASGCVCTIKDASIYSNTDAAGGETYQNAGINMGPSGSIDMNETASAAVFGNSVYDFKNNKSNSGATLKLSSKTYSGASLIWKKNGKQIIDLNLDKTADSYLVSEMSSTDIEDSKVTANTHIASNVNGGVFSDGSLILTSSGRKYQVIAIRAEWDEGKIGDAYRPSYVTFKLERKAAASSTVETITTFELNKGKSYAYTFAALPIANNAGSSYMYAISPNDKTQYEEYYDYTSPIATSEGGHALLLPQFTLKTPDAKTINVQATANWDDSNNATSDRPSSVDLTLLKDSSPVETVTVTATEDWKHTFNNQPKYILDDNGFPTTKEHVYTITQSIVPLYNTTYKQQSKTTTTLSLLSVNKYTGADAHPVTISVVNTSGGAIPGATVNVLNNKDNSILHVATTDSKGQFTVNVVADTYKIKQQTAPKGYVVNSTEYVFTMAKDAKVTGTQTIIDSPTRVSVYSYDSSSNEGLAGAKLKLIDPDGNTVEEWTSETGSHTINGKLAAGEEYSIVETEAPDGYKRIKETTFKTNTDDSVKRIQLSHSKNSTESSTTTTTGTTPTPTTTKTGTVSGNAASPTGTGTTSSGKASTSSSAASSAAAKKASESATTETAKRTGDVRTGDNAQLMLYIIGSAASLAILIFGMFIIIKRNKEKKQLSYLAALKESMSEDDIDEE